MIKKDKLIQKIDNTKKGLYEDKISKLTLTDRKVTKILQDEGLLIEDYLRIKTELEALRESVIKTIYQDQEIFSKSYKPNYLRKNKDERRFKKYREKISKLILIDYKISVPKIAKELEISKQALYQNKDLMKFIRNERLKYE